jgi:hypothetical protein
MFTVDDLKKKGIIINQNPKPGQSAFTLVKPSNIKDVQTQGDTETSFFDKTYKGIKGTFVDMPIAMKKAVTGEDVEIEFPELKEITQLNDIGFWEDLLTEGKIGAVRDDTAKAEVFENTFKGDKRYGGVFTDKFNNLAVQWNDNFYYVNKPGLSDADMNTFAIEIVKFLPISKMMNKAKGLGKKLFTGLTGYTGTEFLSETLENFLAPKTAKAKNEDLIDKGIKAGKLGSVATAIDILTPPSLKLAKEGTKAVIRSTAKQMGVKPPDFVKSTITQSSKYPLTEGQRTFQGGKPTINNLSPTLQKEEMYRYASGTDVKVAGQGVIKAFDDQQLNLIRNDAIELADEFGSGQFGKLSNQVDVGDEANIALKAIEDVRGIITKEADTLKSKASSGYEAIRKTKDQPFISKKGLVNLKRQFNDPEIKLQPFELANLPKTSSIFKQVNQTLDKAIKSGKPLDFKILQRLQKAVNKVQRSAEKGSQDAVEAGQFKGLIDKFVFDGVDQGFITGNTNIINTLKESSDAYAQYIKLMGKGGADKRVNAIMKKLTDRDLAPKELVNAFLGHNKFNPSPVMKKVLNTIKQNIPNDQKQETFALIKDAVLEKAFSGTGKSGITRTNIVNNFNDIFEKNAFFTKELFTPKEIAKIKQFRKDVLPTLFAEIKQNPSGTSYTLVSTFDRLGLLNFTKYLRNAPMLGEAITGAQLFNARQEALDFTKRYILTSRKPILITSEIQATTTPVREELVGVDDIAITEDNENILDFIKKIPPSARNKILQSTEIDTGGFE